MSLCVDVPLRNYSPAAVTVTGVSAPWWVTHCL